MKSCLATHPIIAFRAKQTFVAAKLKAAFSFIAASIFEKLWLQAPLAVLSLAKLFAHIALNG